MIRGVVGKGERASWIFLGINPETSVDIKLLRRPASSSKEVKDCNWAILAICSKLPEKLPPPVQLLYLSSSHNVYCTVRIW